jgi:type IX secretion system PorP/SprF family membrane protein
MKKSIIQLILAIVLLPLGLVYGQQRPQFTHFMLNNYLYNPAVTGINDFSNAQVGYRKQWTGMPGAPTTTYVSVNGSLDSPEPAQSLPVRGRLANQFNTAKPTQSEGGVHGLGGYFLSDQTGPTGFNSGYLSYAYHLPLANSLKLSIGATAGLSQFYLNTSKLGDLNDAAIGAGTAQKLNPDLALGAMLHNDRFFLGYSAVQLFRNRLNLFVTDQQVGRLSVHHFANFGAKFKLSEDVSVVPSVLAKYTPEAPLSIDVNARVNFQELLWVGASFRNEDSFSALLGINFTQNLFLGYSYDFLTSNLAGLGGASHEIVGGYRFAKKGKKITVPTMW